MLRTARNSGGGTGNREEQGEKGVEKGKTGGLWCRILGNTKKKV